jgi:hypothetical protein
VSGILILLSAPGGTLNGAKSDTSRKHFVKANMLKLNSRTLTSFVGGVVGTALTYHVMLIIQTSLSVSPRAKHFNFPVPASLQNLQCVSESAWRGRGSRGHNVIGVGDADGGSVVQGASDGFHNVYG